ncbi:MAG: iron-containing alcohol dehydrogenase [Thomasclavelia sp.]|uniref:iron-containing alcohol dehydrogenase n=1 Tax=Thomasclavelia sp. TaxID=3025757 RepID=UPI0039A267E2
MQRFTLPRDLYHGKGSLEALKTFEGKKAIVCVGGGSMKKNGFLDRAVEYLKEAGMEVRLFEGIEPDPSVETVMKGAAVMEEFQPDWIIAIGGGSPIDAAKAMWIKYEYPEITFEEMCKVFGIPKLRKKAHFCAIPSTSGTATEVTAFSIITDYDKGVKYPIADFEITPDVAIVDPDLAETMPVKLVAHTGMDAMTHAIEAYVSTANCNYTDPLAIHAIEMIQANLVKSYHGDMNCRDDMHDAQCLAGQAFSNALLGIVHSMAHKTGAAFVDQGGHIIHGAANAMYLPKVIAFNAKDETAKKRYGVIADYMHLGGNSDDEKVELLIAYLRKMNDELNIPHSINHYGADGLPAPTGFVSEEIFLKRVENIAALAIEDACTGSNPRIPTQEEMVKLLKACYYDSEVDF